MRGVASAQCTAGARTCVIVGALDAVAGLDLRPYRHVLWWADRGDRFPDTFSIPPGVLAAEFVDDGDRSRAGQVLERFIEKDPLHLPSLIVTESAAGRSEFLPLLEEVVAQFENAGRVRATRQADGFLWQRQLLENLPAYARRRVPASWAGALEGVPAFVCGAGPSLDASIGKLAEFAPRGVVFAADSALRILSERRVAVDFAFSIDAHKTPRKCLPEGVARPERVVLASISPPAWRGVMPEDRQFFLSSRQLTEDWLATLGVPKTKVTAVENCGIAALELAVYLGCRPIYLFGMDHAVDSKDPTKWHGGGVGSDLHDHIGFSAQKNYPKVPGNYQPEIATPLFREWRVLDTLCAGYPPGLVVNVTDRGARLRNTTVVLPDALCVVADGVDRSSALHRLPATDGAEGTAAAQAVDSIGATVERLQPLVARARAELKRGVLGNAVAALTQAYRDQHFSRVMGNYCLKIMPHLVRPDLSNVLLWEGLVDETEQLMTTMRSVLGRKAARLPHETGHGTPE